MGPFATTMLAGPFNFVKPLAVNCVEETYCSESAAPPSVAVDAGTNPLPLMVKLNIPTGTGAGVAVEITGGWLERMVTVATALTLVAVVAVMVAKAGEGNPLPSPAPSPSPSSPPSF